MAQTFVFKNYPTKGGQQKVAAYEGQQLELYGRGALVASKPAMRFFSFRKLSGQQDVRDEPGRIFPSREFGIIGQGVLRGWNYIWQQDVGDHLGEMVLFGKFTSNVQLGLHVFPYRH
jgi:hypothetical protein